MRIDFTREELEGLKAAVLLAANSLSLSQRSNSENLVDSLLVKIQDALDVLAQKDV